MNAQVLTRITNAGMIAGVGLGGGHFLLPARDHAGLIPRLVFVMSVAGTGALAGWRERRSREYDGGEEVRGAESLWVAAGAVVSLAFAWLAYRLMHQ